MYVSKVAMSMLSSMLREWADAIDEGDVARANMLAQALPRSGALVTIHPEFLRHFHDACPGLKPETALEHMSRLLLSATKAHDEATQQHYSDEGEKRMRASDHPAQSDQKDQHWGGDGELRDGKST